MTQSPDLPEPEPEFDYETPEGMKAYIEYVVSDPYFQTEGGSLQDTIRILLASFFVGLSGDKIAKFLNLNRDDFVRPRVKRLREQGVWIGKNTLAIEWFDEEAGYMALLLDAMVAEGAVVRSSWNGDEERPKGGRAGYSAADEPPEVPGV